MRILQAKKILFIIGFFTYTISFDCYAQKTVIKQHSIEIEFIKNKKLNRKHPKSYIKTLHSGFRITLIEVDIKTLDLKKREFDPNKFYLVSEEHKFRYRPLDIFLVQNKKNGLNLN